jgi:predicted Zn-ribbon and HTH transcriptional regulator
MHRGDRKISLIKNIYTDRVKCWKCGWSGHKDELKPYRRCPVCDEPVYVMEIRY